MVKECIYKGFREASHCDYRCVYTANLNEAKHIEETHLKLPLSLKSRSSQQTRSLRPRYRYIESTGEYVFKGYEDVERVGLPIQSSIRDNKTGYCFGNPLWFGNESGDENSEKMANFKAWWNSTNMTACLSQMGYHLFGTGDSAIAIYKDEEGIHYKVFGYENGDCVNEAFEYIDGKRSSIGVRMFQIDGHDAVELYKRKEVELWIKATDDEIKASFGAEPSARSEDGYSH